MRLTLAGRKVFSLMAIAIPRVLGWEQRSLPPRSLVLCRPMKWADLRALQISTRRPSLRKVCTLKVTLTHLNMRPFLPCRSNLRGPVCRHRCSEIQRASPGGFSNASLVCRPRSSFRQTQNSGRQVFFVITKLHSNARQHGLR